MFVTELTFTSINTIDPDLASSAINDFLGALRQNGQILGKEWPIAINDNHCETIVLIPDSDALDTKHHNQYVRRGMEAFLQAGLDELHIKLIGEDIDSADVCTCASRSSFILTTDYTSLESPLRCGDCYCPIPLYRIPPTYDNSEYNDIICWQSDYQACDTLQMNCGTLERAATRELSRFDSSLSKRGREICGRIFELTGKPTYDYLYRYGARSRKQELKRLCPSCGGQWLLDKAWHLYDFKCDTCHLLSNISWDV